jgi:putative aldouronate transport system substrate-binding protein
MKRKTIAVLIACMMLFAAAVGCVSDDAPSATPEPARTANEGASPGTAAGEQPVAVLPEIVVEEEVEEDPEMEFVDGNWRFKETRQITVQIFERNPDPGTPAHDNFYTDWVKAEMLRIHNVEITEYVPMPRWEEANLIPNWLAAGDCPDICITYNNGAIQEYANMGAVHNLSPIVHENRSRLPNLWEFLGETFIYWSRNPETGEIYWIETAMANPARINTFVREDWLNILGIKEPTTTQEFEDMLVAFRDNAELLLGADADKMVPFAMNADVGWQTNNLLVSFAPHDMSLRDRFVYGYDDRQLLWPGNKEAVRLLNRWYNMDLIFSQFMLYSGGDTTVDNMHRAGFTGAWLGNWDMPYRGNNSIQNSLKNEVGPDAAFIAVDPFVNDAGYRMKTLGAGNDRKIFLPLTNTEPKASMFYIDFLCRPDVIQFLQLGVEGINYDLVDGVPIVKSPFETLKDEEGNDVKDEDDKLIIIDDTNLKYIINSPTQLDLLMPINGYYPQGITSGAITTSFLRVEPRYIIKALEAALNDAVRLTYLNLGEIESESGMSEVLSDKRNTLYANAIRASEADFDRVYDMGMAEYLASGGQAIIDERAARFDMYGPEEN